ncbi:hypothetical protein [Pedobacter agri]|uniref:hypothetical protein n=1 Tax=Pedobacter agri TaxID=454586 RepID=UPI0027826D15|nr:hypothetical protein [Pedobacter agri]MDQ1142118.1 hypothetical protein [Pedobacter agri]
MKSIPISWDLWKAGVSHNLKAGFAFQTSFNEPKGSYSLIYQQVKTYPHISVYAKISVFLILIVFN